MDNKGWTLTLKNFRGIELLEWSPYGVSLLTGYNGSGKTSTLESLRMIRGFLMIGKGALSSFSQNGTGKEETVGLGFSVGGLTFVIEMTLDAQGDYLSSEDHFRHGGEAFNRPSMQSDYLLIPGIKALVKCLYSIRVHVSAPISTLRAQIQKSMEKTPDDVAIRSFYCELSSWRKQTSYHHKFNWVISEFYKAFPACDYDIFFDGETTDGQQECRPIAKLSDGEILVLWYLTSIAEAEEGGTLTFEAIETQLHPFVLRSLLKAMREQAEKKGLTIILTTHSPVLLSAFKGVEDQVFVFQYGRKQQPTALNLLRHEDWLAHFALGDLYDRLSFGFPGS